MREPGAGQDRKALIRRYKETSRTMGVCRVLNTENGRFLIDASVDVRSLLNRHRAQLRMQGHPSRGLQRDWVALGPESFAFEVLDTLGPADDPEYDPSGDLRELENLWVQKLEAEGDTRYT